MKYLWITGMFRSGTTLMAKIFDAHPDVAFASDPYRPYFNDYRDRVASDNGLLKEDPPHLPLSDYFCDDEQLQVMRLIQKSDFNEKISGEHLEDLKARISARGMEFSPFVAERAGELTGGSYRELFDFMMPFIRECYGKGHEEVVGGKEVWCNEFIGPLLDNFDNLKVINIVRDPRAVFASRNIVGEKYPWLFLARQWRKLTAFSWLFSKNPAYADRLMLIRYEDLIGDPGGTARKMCSFTGIDYSPDMIDGTKFREGDGTSWAQNSSYGSGKEISNKYADKWKEKLTSGEIRLIEMLCYHEMRLFGYEPVNGDASEMDEELVYKPRIVKKEDLAGWIRPLTDTGLVSNATEMSKELLRSRLLRASDDKAAGVGRDLLDSLFVDKMFFNEARKNILEEEKVRS